MYVENERIEEATAVTRRFIPDSMQSLEEYEYENKS